VGQSSRTLLGHSCQAPKVRITEKELIVYGPDIREIARHPPVPFRNHGREARTAGARPRIRSSSEIRTAEGALRRIRRRWSSVLGGTGPHAPLREERGRARVGTAGHLPSPRLGTGAGMRGPLPRFLPGARWNEFWPRRRARARCRKRSPTEAQELAEVLRQPPLSVRPTAEYQVLLEENEIGHEEDDDSRDPTALPVLEPLRHTGILLEPAALDAVRSSPRQKNRTFPIFTFSTCCWARRPTLVANAR
jgi:hypothetical protein